jgi:hypothetical protein
MKTKRDDADDEFDGELEDYYDFILYDEKERPQLAFKDEPDHDPVNGGSIKSDAVGYGDCRRAWGMTFTSLTLTYEQGVKLADWLHTTALPRLREHERRLANRQAIGSQAVAARG